MPLTKFQCSICGAKCPRKYLLHGKTSERMDWLRRHYKRKHPRAFAGWYNKKSTGKINKTKTGKRLNKIRRRIHK